LGPEKGALTYGARFLVDGAPDKEFPAGGMAALDAMLR
jgi:hypothetical protein